MNKEIRIRGYHCDAYGHVNNARYLEFYEECRWTFLQPAMDKKVFEALGVIFVVVNVELSYKKPLLPEDLAVVSIQDLEYSNMSMTIHQSISVEDKICSTAKIKFVLLDEGTQKARAVDDEIVRIFESLKEQ